MFKKSIAAQRPFKLALIASIAMLGAASAPSFAASTTATATATVVTPINVTKATDLNFGKFIAGPGGNVTVSTSGARTFSGVTLVTGIAPAAASFSVTGEPTTTYSIDTTTNTSTALTNGANTMALAIASDLTAANVTSGTVTSGSLSAGGAQTVYVGGQLTVGANQVPGVYTGTIAIAVNYN